MIDPQNPATWRVHPCPHCGHVHTIRRTSPTGSWRFDRCGERECDCQHRNGNVVAVDDVADATIAVAARTDPMPLSEGELADIRRRHADHPYCDTCKVLLQLDAVVASHKLDVLALKAQIANR